MSWTVENSNDKLIFFRRFLNAIENHFNLKFCSEFILAVQEWRQIINDIGPINFSKEDFSDFASKEKIMFGLRRANTSK